MKVFFRQISLIFLLLLQVSTIPSSFAADVITFTANDSGGNQRLMRIAAAAGASVFNVSTALNPLAKTSGRDSGPITVSSNGSWYVFQSERFDLNIDGYAALMLAPSSLASIETVRSSGQAIHCDGRAQVNAAGNAIVYSSGDGPHSRDLFLVRRLSAGVWSSPVCLTTGSSFAFHSWPVLTADETRICMNVSQTDQYGGPGTSIAEVRLDGSGFRVLVSAANAPSGVSIPSGAYCAFPAPAPDGSVVFEAIWGGPERIWRRAAAGGTPVLLSSAPYATDDNSPIVLPNGKVISLVLPGAVHQLKMTDANGANAVLLTPGTFDVLDIGVGAGGTSLPSTPPTTAVAPTFTSGESATFSVGTAGQFTVTAKGTPAPAFTVTGGVLPNGLTLNSTTGVISGTPSSDAAGTHSVIITASNGTAPDATQMLTLSLPVIAVGGHPRLWLTSQDLPRLRSWAISSNPIYQSGILARATSAKAYMDAGRVPANDSGGVSYEGYPCEMYAELFAFMSLISPDQATRDNYAQRARTLLMYIINKAALGVDNSGNPAPFRAKNFSTNDRSRWYGSGFGLTVDWIYSYLSTSDKTLIRSVFLRWIDENLNAGTTDFNHPTPIGTTNNPILVNDPVATRFAGNNYYAAHMRNIGLMSMSLDATDDPSGTLRAYLSNATGAWLYVTDNLMRGDARGGILPEGFEYAPQTMGYAAQFLLALQTSGNADPAKLGPQVVLTANPFWDEHIPAYLHSVSPVPKIYTAPSYLGPLYQPSWFGACSHFYADDPIEALGPLGIYDAATGNTARASAARWIQTNIAPGGPSVITERARNGNFFRQDILYFMLMDPTAPAPVDPRPTLPLDISVPGVGHLSGRTAWDDTASWFTYALGWNSIDHQSADGNKFEFYRKGEWLTKSRLGYDLDYLASDNHNTLSLQNDATRRAPGDYRYMLGQRGSQWLYVNSGDPVILSQSLTSDYIYATGDSTNLYNTTNEGCTDITHASRSIFWLKPDHIVIYDRATSKTANRFKRFNLHLPSIGVVSGTRTTMSTPSGQRLITSTLLPTDATITVQQEVNEPSGRPADYDDITHRLLVEAPGGPTNTRFLHVLQGTDAGAPVSDTTLIESTSGSSYAGASVDTTVVLFPVNLDAAFTTTSYTAPAGTTNHYLSGLTPNTGYTVNLVPSDTGILVTVSNTPGPNTTDSGGVLSVHSGTTTALPFVSISPATAITASSATLNGMLNPHLLQTTAQFEYGETADYGTVATLSLSPDNDAVTRTVNTQLTGLAPGTTYHYRITASNSAGNARSIDGTFSTEMDVAPLLTLERVVGTPLTNGATVSFGKINEGKRSLPVTFRIRNRGTATLTDLLISLEGENSAEFVVSTPSAVTIAPNSFATFTVAFTPSSSAQEIDRTATLQIASNDIVTGTFAQTLTGSALGAPLITSPVLLPDGIVGGTYRFQVPIDQARGRIPTSYSAVGLPSGLTIHPTTGIISGKPTISRTPPYPITLRASNALGISTANSTLLLSPLSQNAVGVFNGLVSRDDTLNAGNGGVFSMTTLPTGTFSGRLRLGALTYPFTGTLDSDVTSGASTASIRIPRTVALRPLFVGITIDSNTGQISGTINSEGQTEVALTAWRNPWNATTNRTPLAAGYNAALELDSALVGTNPASTPAGLVENVLYPQGTGYTAINISTAGLVTWTGRMSDGTAVSISTTLGPNGDIPVNALLYPTGGAIHGWVTATADSSDTPANNGLPLLDGVVNWDKKAMPLTPANRLYRAGFPLHQLTVRGGKYVPPTRGTSVLSLADAGLNTFNARLVFTDGGLWGPDPFQAAVMADSLNRSLRITNTNVLILPVASVTTPPVTLSINPTLGTMAGSFTIKNDLDLTFSPRTITRTVTYSGMFIPRQGINHGAGYFLLPQMPVVGPPKTTILTSPILSGQVLLEPL